MLASGSNADEIAEMMCPQIGTDDEASRVVKSDCQELGGDVEPQRTRIRHIYSVSQNIYLRRVF